MSDITIRKLAPKDKSVVTQIVDIHLATFEGFFLTFMGRGFLKQMYKAYIKHSKSDILVAEDENGVIGFLAYSEQMSGLYKYMIRHQLIPFAWYSLWAFVRNPKIFMRLVRAFLKPREAQRKESYVELSSIGVHPDVKSKGVGSSLMDNFKLSLDFDKYSYVTLETDAINNDGANHFYKKHGFILSRSYHTREGRQMNEYRLYSEDV